VFLAFNAILRTPKLPALLAQSGDFDVFKPQAILTGRCPEAKEGLSCVGPSLVQKNKQKYNKTYKKYKNDIKIIQQYRIFLYFCIIFILFLYCFVFLLHFLWFFCTRDGPTQGLSIRASYTCTKDGMMHSNPKLIVDPDKVLVHMVHWAVWTFGITKPKKKLLDTCLMVHAREPVMDGGNHNASIAAAMAPFL